MQLHDIIRWFWRPGYYAIAIVVLITVGSLMPAESTRALPGTGFAKHAVPYALLSLFALLALKGRFSGGLVLLGVFGFGLMLECIQPVFGRVFDAHDLIANAVGGLAGLGTALVFGCVAGQLTRNSS